MAIDFISMYLSIMVSTGISPESKDTIDRPPVGSRTRRFNLLECYTKLLPYSSSKGNIVSIYYDIKLNRSNTPMICVSVGISLEHIEIDESPVSVQPRIEHLHSEWVS